MRNDASDVIHIQLNDFENHSLLLILFLMQKKGFLNKMLYEISLKVKEVCIENDFNNFSNLHTDRINQLVFDEFKRESLY